MANFITLTSVNTGNSLHRVNIDSIVYYHAATFGAAGPEGTRIHFEKDESRSYIEKVETVDELIDKARSN